MFESIWRWGSDIVHVGSRKTLFNSEPLVFSAWWPYLSHKYDRNSTLNILTHAYMALWWNIVCTSSKAMGLSNTRYTYILWISTFLASHAHLAMPGDGDWWDSEIKAWANKIKDHFGLNFSLSWELRGNINIKLMKWFTTSCDWWYGHGTRTDLI